MSSLIYALEWSHFCVYFYPKNSQNLLATLPANIFQLKLWSEVMLHQCLNHFDQLPPQCATLYLSQKTYMPLLLQLPECQQQIYIFLLDLVRYFYKIDKGNAILNNLENEKMMAFALCSSSKTPSNQLRQATLRGFFKKNTNFVAEETFNKIVECFLPHSANEKYLCDLSDQQIGKLILNHLENCEYGQRLSIFITAYKQSKLILDEMIKILMWQVANKITLDSINFIIEVASNLDRKTEILLMFEKHSFLFYSYFWNVIQQPREKHKPFINFMIHYSSIRSIKLHEAIYCIQPPLIRYYQTHELLSIESSSIFHRFRYLPTQTASQCLDYYLKKSQFVMPQKFGIHSFEDPVGFVAVKKSIWEHPFHNQVINYCLWVLLQRRLSQAAVQNLKNQKGFKLFSKNLYLVLVHISIGYRAGTFLNYFAAEYNRWSDLFEFQNLPTLLLRNPDFGRISWVTNYVADMAKILQLIDGQSLIEKMIRKQYEGADYHQLNIIQIQNIIISQLVLKKNAKTFITHKKVLKLLQTINQCVQLENQWKQRTLSLISSIKMLWSSS